MISTKTRHQANRAITAILLVFAMILTVIFFIQYFSEDVEAIDPYDPDLEIATGYTINQSGKPGDKVKYYLDLFNKGSNDDTYSLSHSPITQGWGISISPTSIAVDEDNDETIIVSITIPLFANDTDSIEVAITATSQNDPEDPPANSTILLICEVNQVYELEAKNDHDDYYFIVDPGEGVYVEINLTNKGNGEDTIAVAKDAPDGADDWIVISNYNSVTLKPDESIIINISFTPTSDNDAGKFPFDIIFTSEDGDEVYSVTVIIEVRYKADFIVLPYGDNQKDVEPKGSATFGATIENKGNDHDTISIEIQSDDWEEQGWSISLDYQSITISQDDEIDLTTLVTVDAPDGPAGADLTLIINFTSSDGELVKTLVIKVTISQVYDPGISITGGTSKSGDPGNDINFTIQVFNNGNGEDEITLSIKNDDQTPGSWGNISDTSVTLDAHKNTTITLTVTPPSHAAYRDEGYTIQIYGTSEDEENVTTMKTIKVNVNRIYDLSVSIVGNSTEKSDPDNDLEYSVKIKNKGNAEDTILLSLYGGVGGTWKPTWASITNSVDLEQNESTTVTLYITIPEDAPKGNYQIGIRGTSEDDPATDAVNDTAEVVVSVNQIYQILISIPTAQKSVDVDSSVDYEITIKNYGNGNDTISLEITDYPEDWLVNFNATYLDLAAGESGNITMIVETPSHEAATTFVVNFTATSENAPESDPVVVLGSTRTKVNQTFEFDVVSTPDYRSAVPGDTLEFNISFINQGTGDDHVAISIGGDFPASWTVSIASDVTLNIDQTIVKTLTVTIDGDTLKDEYHLTLTGISDDDQHTPAFTREENITINVDQEYKLTVSISEDSKSIVPFPASEVHKVIFSFAVNNTGTGPDKFDFSAVFDPSPARNNGWSVAFSPETIDLGVKNESIVNVIITVPYKENIGTYGLTITAKSQGDPSIMDTITLTIEVNQTYDMDVTTNFAQQRITPSEYHSTFTEVNFTLNITNTGTGDDNFSLNITNLPEGWLCQHANSTEIFHMSDSLDVIISILIPGREPSNLFALNLTITSTESPSTAKIVTFQVFLDKLHAINAFTAEPIQMADPDNFTTFDMVITNKGTVNDTFYLDYHDLSEYLTISFPDGPETSELEPLQNSSISVRVRVDQEAPPHELQFNISVTSSGDEAIQDAIILTIDVNQSYALSVSQTGQPAGNNLDPGAIVIYQFELTNDGTGTDSITIEIPITLEGGEGNVPTGWVISPIPYSFDLESDKTRVVDIEVEVDDAAMPVSNSIKIWFFYHNGTENVSRSITIIVNQTYDVSTNINFNPLPIFPGFNKTAILTVKNTGTGVDFYKIEISNVDGITAIPDISMTNNLEPGDASFVLIDFNVGGGEEPRTETFWINVTSMEAREEGLDVIATSILDVKIGDTYGVMLSKPSGTYQVSPTFDADGEKTFQLSIINEGSAEDTFLFEFAEDSTTQIYKSWITLPIAFILGPGSATTETIEISVPPHASQAIALAGQYDINIIVYSDSARKNDIESEETTAVFTCTVDVKEYRKASITSVDPSILNLAAGDVSFVNFTITNKGNGWENYTFEKDGEQPGGTNTGWYDFLDPTSVNLAPGGSMQVTIIVDLTDHPYALVGIHDLEFHANAEIAYVTDAASFRLIIEESFGGEFVNGDTKWVNPGETVPMEIMVMNTGNAPHELKLNNPILPDDWTYSWPDGNSKLISEGKSGIVTLNITIPTDHEKARAGEYSFEITGKFEDVGGGFTTIPGSVFLNITVNEIRGVELTKDYSWTYPRIRFDISIKNIGNSDDMYHLEFIRAQDYPDVTDWAILEGTDLGNNVSLPTGETAFFNVIIDIPEFTKIGKRPGPGTYGVNLMATSLSEGGVEDEIVLEFIVEESYDVNITSLDAPKIGRTGVGEGVELSFTFSVENLGNVDDEVKITIPLSDFTGNWEDLDASILGNQGMVSEDMILPILSLESQEFILDLVIKDTMEPGDYSLAVIAESLSDSWVYSKITFQFTIHHVPTPVITSINFTPSVVGQMVQFSGGSISYDAISRYLWVSDIDGEIYNGSHSLFLTSDLSFGNHVITLRVQTLFGTWSEVVGATHIVHEKPVIESFIITPEIGEANQSVIFEVSGVDDGWIEEYKWISSIDHIIYNGSDPMFHRSDLSIGDHIITLSVRDNYGVWSSSEKTVLTITPPPTPPPQENQEPELLISDQNSPESKDPISVHGTTTIQGFAIDRDGDEISVNISIDGGPWQEISNNESWSYEWDTTAMDDGHHTITILASDGKDYSEIITITYKVENEDDHGNPIFLYLLLGILATLIFLVLKVDLWYKPKSKKP